MDIQNSQKTVDTWIKEHGVHYFNELTNMSQLTKAALTFLANSRYTPIQKKAIVLVISKPQNQKLQFLCMKIS